MILGGYTKFDLLIKNGVKIFEVRIGYGMAPWSYYQKCIFNVSGKTMAKGLANRIVNKIFVFFKSTELSFYFSITFN